MTYFQPVLPVLVVSLFWMCWRLRKSPGVWLLYFATIGLALVTSQPFAWLLLYPLESRYSKADLPVQDADAIVVLSSAVFGPAPPRKADLLGGDTYERCLYAASLHLTWKPLPVIASGGGSRGGIPYSASMAKEIAAQGVPGQLIWTEDRSLSTHDNAVYSAELLRGKGLHKVVLVTEAYHMPRAERCFRNAGLVVIPAPCGFRINYHGSLNDFVPTWTAIVSNEETLHEYVGLAWYKIRGWI